MHKQCPVDHKRAGVSVITINYTLTTLSNASRCAMYAGPALQAAVHAYHHAQATPRHHPDKQLCINMSSMQRASTMEVAAEQHWLHDTDPLQLKGHTGRVFDVAFCPVYSGLLASASDDNSVRFWGIDDTGVSSGGRQIGKCAGHKDSVLRVTWQSDGQLLSTASADTTVKLWQAPAVSGINDLQDAFEVAPKVTLEGHPEEVYACEFIPDNSLLTASADKLFLWDLNTGTQLQQAQQTADATKENGHLPARWQSGALFSAKPQPGGTLIATACSDGVLRLWDLRSGSLVNSHSIPLFEGMTAACAWEPNGHCIASVATAGDICALDIRTEQKLWSGKAGCPLRDCCYLPNNIASIGSLVTAGSDGSLYTCSHRENQGSSASLQAIKPQPQSLLCVNSAEDGSVIAAAGGTANKSHGVSPLPQPDAFAINLYSQGAIICC